MCIATQFSHGVDYIEDMLTKQLVQAIGKQLGPSDFAAYMVHHHRQLFKPLFSARPFSYAVRRPHHSPEGSLSIEVKTSVEATMSEPVLSTARYMPRGHPMAIPLSASIAATFHGEHFLHSLVSTKFSGTSGLEYSLVARARQFSSFILLVGSIPAPDQFTPEFSIILSNKDDLRIPLQLAQLPTPKEFKDATASLSPEQKRFAKAYRAMQLSSTLFGVCLIQIKPQLEKLLNLPPESLTKEIKLTQELQQLFIHYGIPSDLLSFTGDMDQADHVKLTQVKRHVAAMQDMLHSIKQSQVDDKALHEILQELESPPPEAIAPSWDGCMSEDDGEATGCTYDDDAGCCDELESVMCASGPAPTLDCGYELESLMCALGPPVSAPAPPPIDGPKAADEPPKELSLDFVPSAKKFSVDYTKIPSILDKKYKQLDEDAALRPTTIKAVNTWTLCRKPNLVLPAVTSTLVDTDLIAAQKASFDLLDALSRSGALSIDHAQFHVVLAATHCFDKSLVDTIVQDNVNPIEKVERSMLIIASTIHDTDPQEMVNPEHLQRLNTHSPQLFLENQ